MHIILGLLEYMAYSIESFLDCVSTLQHGDSCPSLLFDATVTLTNSNFGEKGIYASDISTSQSTTEEGQCRNSRLGPGRGPEGQTIEDGCLLAYFLLQPRSTSPGA